MRMLAALVERRSRIARGVEGVVLAVALVAVALSAYLPHAVAPEAARAFPLHLDEYVHWGYARAMLDDGTLAFTDPLSGEAAAEGLPPVAERGFHALLGLLQAMTGASWPTLFHYGPTVVAVFLGLVAYALARRWGGGIYAAVFVAFIPTSIRFLGPGYLVPIALALPLVLLGIQALLEVERSGRPWAFAVFAAGAWTIHVMAGFALAAAAGLYALTLARRRIDLALVIGAATFVPLLLAGPLYFPHVASGFTAPTLPASLGSIRVVGGVFLGLAGLGAFALVASARPDVFRAGIVLSGLLLAFLGTILFRNVWGFDPFHAYDRSVVMAMLAAGLLASAALAFVARAGSALLAAHRPRLAAAPLGAILVALLVAGQAFALAPVLEARAAAPAYGVLDDATFERYAEAGRRLEGVPGRAFVEGSSAMAFADITRRPVVFAADPSTVDVPPFVESFFASGANDTAFLIEAGATVVVTRRAVTNPDLVPVMDGVHVLRPEIIARLSR